MSANPNHFIRVNHGVMKVAGGPMAGSGGRLTFFPGAVLVMMVGTVMAQSAPNDRYQAVRDQLVRDVLVPGGVRDPRVLKVIASTPRHEFVDASQRDKAYFDMALPIGESQTISSPYIVAVMTEALDPKPNDKVLEIGTGSGYQAAVLSPLVKEVYTIEIVPPLGETATKLLRRLGYKNIQTRIGDGFQGWQEAAPFDKIIVTCSPEKVPQPLQDQLAEGGLMVIPVGERYQQTLYLMRKKNGVLEQETLRPTLFVPMTGEAEDQRVVQADPKNPRLINGDFEEPLINQEHVPGWYYQFGMKVVEDRNAPKGLRVVEFQNDVARRPTLLLQGLPLDGRQVRKIRLGAWVSTTRVKGAGAADEQPAALIQFFDEDRKRLGYFFLGPYSGTRKWRHDEKVFDVPAGAREAIVTIGMFGATGTTRFDGVTLEVVGAEK
jgi:protein-L-isoaspartate(D-aspartate) O-methyltransferase